MVKIDDHTNVDLDALAIEHYNYLVGVPLVDGVSYHATASLIGRIRRQRISDASIPNQTRVEFWDYLLENNFANLIRMITGRPPVLKEVIQEIEDLCGQNYFADNLNYENATLTEFGKIVKTVFNYRSYRDDDKCAANCNKFFLLYCPYCNSNEVQVITQTNHLNGQAQKQALLQLDHFYPQSRHPYFAVSFFNLIPGCAPCNAQIKGEKSFGIDTHFNPFHKRLDDYFLFELDNLILKSESDVAIVFRNKQSHATNALNDFKILDRYNNANKRMVFKMYKAFKHRSPKLRNALGQITGLFIAESKTRLLLDNYNVPLNQNEINNVHLGKLKRDIAIQLKILKP